MRRSRRRVRVTLAGASFVVAAACSPSVVETAETTVAPTTTQPVTTTTTPTTTREATTTTTEAPRAPIVLGFAGDTSFTNGLDERDPFGAIGDLLSAPDLMTVNLETAVADPDVGRVAVSKPFLFKSPPSSLQLLVDAGVDAVGLANNHALDFGPDALAQTLVEVDAAGLARVGGGNDEAEAYRPLVVTVGDWQVGLVALSRVPCDWSASGENVRPQIAWACPAFDELADTMVRDTVAAADVTVAMVHGGEEGVLCPSDFMIDETERLAELGVDAVVNGHPHVVQGVTSIGDAIVVRSSGNFAFPSARGITANSAVFLFHVSEGDDGAPVLELEIVPVRADGGVITRADEAQAAEILDQIGRHSDGWRVGPDGVVVEDPQVSSGCLD